VDANFPYFAKQEVALIQLQSRAKKSKMNHFKKTKKTKKMKNSLRRGCLF